jgi:alanine racemase
MFSIQDVLSLTHGKLLQLADTTYPIQYLLTNSRQLTSPSSSLFFAIPGERHDGHQYLNELYQRGVRQFVVEARACTPSFLKKLDLLKNASILQVDNSVEALQAIATAHRQLFQVPVIGITGSNGKTIVKEWLAQLLDPTYRIVKSPKSYNSQIGVPLSVWQINRTHTLGIFEAGISQPGEMIRLEAVIQPTMGVFTNLGPAHAIGFDSDAHKANEKMQLFLHCETLIYCQDYDPIKNSVQQVLKSGDASFQPFSWSRHQPADLQVIQLDRQTRQTRLVLAYQFQEHEFIVPFVDEASIENVIHCICVLLLLEVSWEEMAQRIQLLRPVAMRLELKEGINGCYLVDDTYNNDLAGLSMALDFLNLQKQRSHKILILSDVLESGLPETELYQRIAELVRDKGMHTLIGVGEVMMQHRHLFHTPGQFYDSTEGLLNSGDLSKINNSLILIKGARKFSFELLVQRLQQKTHGTILEINLDAISHNLNHYQNKLGSQTKMMVMVKAFAYGSGSAEVASLLQFHRVDYLAVAYADEGVALREKGIQLPIMVMNPAEESFHKLLEYKLEPEIYSFRLLNRFLQYLQATDQFSAIHVKFDTGMRRLGFEENDLLPLVNLLKASPSIRVATVFTHLAASDDPKHYDFTIRQLQQFENYRQTVERELGYPVAHHALNSAGIVRFSAFKMDMVRLGVGLYGVSAYADDQSQLRTVGTLKTVISQIKHLKAGETVGYGRRGLASADTTIATIAIGYADGYDRRFSNGVGKVLVNGIPCPTIGSVCMDMTMIDITHAEAEEGDEVIVFGEKLPITEMAHSIGTIPYEILTSIGGRVKRVFFQE